MSQNEERRRILDLLSQQKISAEEADKLITALMSNNQNTSTLVAERVNYKYLRVSAITAGEETVNVRIPLQLIKSGLRLGSLLPSEVGKEVENAIKEKTGNQIDLSKINAQDIEELLESLNDLEINIASKDTVIKVYCE